MLPNSRIVPPPSSLDKERHPPYPSTNSSLKEKTTATRYLSRVVPPPATPPKHQGVYSSAHHPLQQQQQQQVTRKPLTEADLNKLPLPNNKSDNKSISYNHYHSHNHNHNHNHNQKQQLKSATNSNRSGRQELQPPLSPTTSSSPLILPKYDSFLDTSSFQAHDRSYMTDALTAEDAKKKSYNGRKGLGKFFKKLGKSMDDDEAPQVRSVGNVLSVKSSRSYHNIPLAPPPPPAPPSSASTSTQPDDLISTIPQEYRSRLLSDGSINGMKQKSHTQPSLTRTLTTDQHEQHQEEKLLTNSAIHINTPPPAPVYHEPLKDHEPIDRARSSSSLSSSTAAHTPPRWSVSTRKSSVSYSIYSTFGADSFTSQEALDSTTTASSTFSTSICSKERQPLQQSQLLANCNDEESDDNYIGKNDETVNGEQDLAQIVANNVQRRNRAKIVSNNGQDQQEGQFKSNDTGNNYSMGANFNASEPNSQLQIAMHNNGDMNNSNSGVGNTNNCNAGLNGNENDDGDDEDDDDDDDDDDENDDIFVDATGFSQDDMERERFDSRLSKRLSGGHFGSAGGLLLSIEAAAQRRTKQQQKHRQSTGYDKALPNINYTYSDNEESKSRTPKQTKIAVDNGVNGDNDNNTSGDIKKYQGSQGVSKKDKAQVRQSSVDASTGAKNDCLLSKLDKKDVVPSTVATLNLASTVENSSSTISYNKITDGLFDSPLAISSFWNENPNLVLNEFGSGLLSASTSTQSIRSSDSSPHSVDTKEAKEMAEKMWNEDESIVTKSHMAEWLGTRKNLNSLVLVSYMSHFEFSSMRLDSAFRKLCGKLYFKAEAQQIDRILDVFAKRYWKCNPQSIFGSSDVVYAVVYSLLLLNTDLHVAQGNYARMTKQAFVKNTMSTIYDQSSVKITKAWEMNIESYLKDMYTSVKQHQILQPMSDRTIDSDTVTLEKRSSLIGGRRVLEMRRNMGAIIRKSMHEPNITVEEAEQPVISPVKSPSSPLSTSQQRKRDSISSVGSGTSSIRNPSSLLTPHSQQSMYPASKYGSSSASTQSPYLKEGVIMRKHLLENATQKAKHRDWRECFVVVGDGELKMYTLQNGHPSSNGFQQASNKVSSFPEMDRRSLLRSSGIGFTAMADSLSSKSGGSGQESVGNGNKWGNFSQIIGTIPLSHSLANVLPPPGYNRQRPFVFAIQQSHGGVYLFQAGSQSQVNDWATACNYWAARQSKEPLPGGVSNMEYGWGNCLHDVILNLDEDDLYRKEQPIGVLHHNQPHQFNHPQQHQLHQHHHHHHQQSSTSSSSSSSVPSSEVMVYDWLPPAPPMVSSSLDEKEQYEALQKHLNMLNSDINDHREIKKKMMVKFPSKHPQHAKVMSNWESKSKYLLHEIIKYQNYCDVLEKNIYLQE